LAECPFCGSEISDDLVSFGGTCPKCFAEIPGEEAATDPGADVRAAQERRDRRRATLRTVAGLTFLLMIVSCTGIAAFAVVIWPEPQVAEILDFDTLDFPTPDLIGVEEVAPQPRVRPTPRPSSEPAPAEPARVPRVEIGPLPKPGTKTPAKTPAPSLSLDPPPVRRDDNVVLSDPEAIRDMIGERMVEFIPGLKICYDRRLKTVPTLKGRWRLNFTIGTSGLVSSASAVGLDRKDKELEACLVSHVKEQWRFGKITITQPVQRTLRFQP
jgi:hypothetical protein